MQGLWRINQRIGQWRAMRVIRQALQVAYPFILVMTLISAIGQSCLAANGFFFRIYHIGAWLPGLTLWRQAFQVMGLVVNNVVAVMIAFTTAYFLARAYHRNGLAVGLLSALAFLTLNVNYDMLDQTRRSGGQFVENNLGPQGIFLGILVGLFIGWLASWLLKRLAGWHWFMQFTLTGRVAWLLVVVMVLTVAIGYGMSWLTTGGLNGLVYQATRAMISNPGHQGVMILAVTAFNNLLWWLGLIGPVSLAGNSSVTALQNLATAVQHDSVWNLPHPITLHTLGDAYANFGGAGMTLALIIAIWLGSTHAHYRRIANQTFLPNLVNLNEATLLGLPVLYNPILLIPFIAAPTVNILLAWCAITWKWVPPMAYPMPRTTPGPLMAYMGTGGDWRALALSIVCLAVSVLIYLPFVRLLNQDPQPEEEERDDHAA
ncbi:PTS transporter subunit EIIC [Levilactobacillus spicheri]|uniref:Permease IIC component n=2 Tax=Levilactobacillus spicheri TaxID=216463 RepID=A0ABQ0WQT4_9LACO|nr:PTS transporter subunit EIIC [Levilactobacillus spicheri]KRL48847.1 cellobiose-specific PTS system IIC component [Levilactobacillus spicheri DSM 15429]GEO67493.1 permease IIC component [Levilactobacillus spicheri]